MLVRIAIFVAVALSLRMVAGIPACHCPQVGNFESVFEGGDDVGLNCQYPSRDDCTYDEVSRLSPPPYGRSISPCSSETRWSPIRREIARHTRFQPRTSLIIVLWTAVALRERSSTGPTYSLVCTATMVLPSYGALGIR